MKHFQKLTNGEHGTNDLYMVSHKSSAFTLIELLLVVALLGILLAIAVPSLNWIRKNTGETKKDIAIHRVAEAKIQYYANNRTTKTFTPPHLTREPAVPHTEDLLPYLKNNKKSSLNAFYSNTPESMFGGCFPSSEVWVLLPNKPGLLPSYLKLEEDPGF